MRMPVRISVTLVVALSLLGLAAPGASASPGAKGYFTMWQDDGYKGQQEARKRYDNNLGNDSCPGCDPGPGGNFGDDMSSFDNNTPYWWALHVDKDSYGDVFCVRPYSRDADLGNNGVTNLEDEISSVYREGKTQPNILRCTDKYHTIGNTY